MTGWYGQTLVFSRGAVPDLGYGPGDYRTQDDRLEAIAAAHPEVDWLGRVGGVGGVYSAYVHFEHGGGLQRGGRTLRELLDKLQEFFEGTDSDEPDTG